MTNGQSAHRTRMGESPVGVRPAWLINNRLPICGNLMRKDSCEKETSAVRRELNPAAYYWRGGCRLAGSHLGSGLYISTCVITIYHKPPIFFPNRVIYLTIILFQTKFGILDLITSLKSFELNASFITTAYAPFRPSQLPTFAHPHLSGTILFLSLS